MKKLVAALLTLGLIGATTSCSNAFVPPTSTHEKVAPALQPFYDQEVKWDDCADGNYCGSVKVPLDWKHPSEKSVVKIAVVVHRASGGTTDQYLLTNPGGPGASGYSFVKYSLKGFATKALIDKYNIVGFDPRGVDESEAITCLDSKRTDKFLYADSGYEYGSAADLAVTKKAIKEFVDGCKAHTGPILGFVDTVSAARDLDVIRAALGSSKLNYLGFSYGTLLGNTYAALYPKKVGRMVLDGAEDPLQKPEEKSLSQLKGFDVALRSYLANCLSQTECQFQGSLDQAQQRISQLLRQIEINPLPTKSGRELTIAAATTGLLMALYSDKFWPNLDDAFSEAFAGKGDTFLALADSYNERTPQGDFLTNGLEAFYAISCLDDRADASAKAMAAQNARAIQTSKVLGRYWQYGALMCSMWPYQAAKKPASYAAEGSPTILVVGTTKDPATPYSQAVKLANSILAQGFLVTFNGDGHTAYGRGSACIDKTVDDFLLNGRVPDRDPDCD